ncbi:MAG: peptidoglycan-binding protein [Bacteroidetes bacterium]|nr:peptidoglycan-binding protein [Bacteroidota bacterium]
MYILNLIKTNYYECNQIKIKRGICFSTPRNVTKIGYSQVNVDGSFGKISEAAVMDFQAKNNLVVDGVVGPKTWMLIYEKAKPKVYIRRLNQI